MTALYLTLVLMFKIDTRKTNIVAVEIPFCVRDRCIARDNQLRAT